MSLWLESVDESQVVNVDHVQAFRCQHVGSADYRWAVVADMAGNPGVRLAVFGPQGIELPDPERAARWMFGEISRRVRRGESGIVGLRTIAEGFRQQQLQQAKH